MSAVPENPANISQSDLTNVLRPQPTARGAICAGRMSRHFGSGVIVCSKTGDESHATHRFGGCGMDGPGRRECRRGREKCRRADDQHPGDAVVYAVPDEVVVNFGVETPNPNWKKPNRSTIRPPAISQSPGNLASKPTYPDRQHEHRNPLQGQQPGRRRLCRPPRLRGDAQGHEKIRDPDHHGVSHGANRLHGFEYRTTELRKFRDQARRMAIKAAHEKAVDLADAPGLSGRHGRRDPGRGGYASYWGSRGGWGGGNAMAQNVAQAARRRRWRRSDPLGQIGIRRPGQRDLRPGAVRKVCGSPDPPPCRCFPARPLQAPARSAAKPTGLPRIARQSYSPGPTLLPVVATRTAWMMSPILIPCSATKPVERRFQRRRPKNRRARPARRETSASSSAPRPACASCLSNALFVEHDLVAKEEVGIGQDVAKHLQPVAGRGDDRASASARPRTAPASATRPARCR